MKILGLADPVHVAGIVSGTADHGLIGITQAGGTIHYQLNAFFVI